MLNNVDSRPTSQTVPQWSAALTSTTPISLCQTKNVGDMISIWLRLVTLSIRMSRLHREKVLFGWSALSNQEWRDVLAKSYFRKNPQFCRPCESIDASEKLPYCFKPHPILVSPRSTFSTQASCLCECMDIRQAGHTVVFRTLHNRFGLPSYGSRLKWDDVFSYAFSISSFTKPTVIRTRVQLM
jgi:hypothetical protein